MTLLTPIAPILFVDPVVGYRQIVDNLQPGERAVIPFDYSIIEQPNLVGSAYLEDLFPNSPILSEDRDLDPYQISQGSFSICGTFASLCSLAAVGTHLPIALENCIYPTERSPHGLYMVRMVDPANPSLTKWVAIDSKMPVTASNRMTFSVTTDGQPLVQTLLLKATAQLRGGCFDAISNSQKWNIPFPGWFPHTSEYCKSFDQFSTAMDAGALASMTFAQQYDAAGNKITPKGIYYAHAYAVTDYFAIGQHYCAMVENPHGVGASDLPNPYADDAPFWADYPELAAKLEQSKRSGGSWWMSLSQLVSMASGGQIKLRKWTGVL